MPEKKNFIAETEERKSFNVIFYAIQMLVCTCIWINIAYYIINNIESFPHKLMVFEFEYLDPVSFELCYVIAYLTAVISHYILFVKFKVYSYSFNTDCKAPFFVLFLNIAFGVFLCSCSTEYYHPETVEPSFITHNFAIISLINYFIFYARYGYEFREREYVEDWHKNVHKPLDWLSKKD